MKIAKRSAAHLHRMRTRDLAKNAFFCIIAGINIHMDAWIKSDMN